LQQMCDCKTWPYNSRSDIVTHSGPDFWSPPLVSQLDQ
jgi:hypothetical protein